MLATVPETAAENGEAGGRRRWSRWWFLLLWLVPALFEGPQYYLAWLDRGEPISWGHAIVRASTRWGLWALLTPVVLACARRIPLRRGVLRTIALHVVLGAGFTALQLLALAIIFEYFFYPHYGWTLLYTIYRVLINSFAISLTAYWAIVAGFYAFDHFREAQERRVAAARLETSLAQARLEALRGQLQPHFLFNTLHAISTLASEGNQRATTRTLTLLADLLRLTLRSSDQLVSLAEELDIVGRYLEIERLRFEDRLTVRIDVAPDLLDAEVPSFLLQPLVENAIRHGIAADPGAGGIDVTVARRGERIVVTVVNTGRAPAAVVGGSGIGLGNTGERLRSLYGAEASLTLSPHEAGGAIAQVALPYRRHRSPAPAPVEDGQWLPADGPHFAGAAGD